MSNNIKVWTIHLLIVRSRSFEGVSKRLDKYHGELTYDDNEVGGGNQEGDMYFFLFPITLGVVKSRERGTGDQVQTKQGQLIYAYNAEIRRSDSYFHGAGVKCFRLK